MTPQHLPLERLLRELALQSPLGDEDRQAILDLPVRIRRLDPLAYLVRDGVVPVICSVLVDGFAFCQKVTGNGSRQILALCFPGDAVDLQNIFLDVADHSVQMLTPGTVADIKRGDLQELVMTRPAVGAAMSKLTLIESSIMREWVVNVGRRHARERIAHLLCEFAVKAETRGLSSDGFNLPMTQEQLADATGLTPVHVNRILKALEAEGLTLVDEAVLRSWVVNAGRRNAYQRVAHLMCEMHLRLKMIGLVSHGSFDLPMTQEELADATALTPVHVNRTLQRLRTDGLIELGGGVLTVLDVDGLQSVAGFDSTYLHIRRRIPARVH